MLERAESPELELRDYLRVLRRRKWIVALAVILVAGSALALSLIQTPTYRATADLLLQPKGAVSLFDPNTGRSVDPERAVQTEIEVLDSGPVRRAVEKKLGDDAPELEAKPKGQTDVIAVSATSTDPRLAARTANAYAEGYIAFRRTQAVDALSEAGKEIQGKLSRLDADVASINREIEATPPPQRAQVADSLERRRDTLTQQQAVFRQALDQLQVDVALKDGGAQLVSRAETPEDPVSPLPKRNAALGVVVGLMLGVGLAFLLEHFDDRIKTKEDLERAIPGVPVVGLVPQVSEWKDPKKPEVVSLDRPASPTAESYRALRTSIQFMGLDRQMRTLQVTSPSAAEGKSTTLANLGVALARAGQRVVLVDCDLRRPRIHGFFGLENTVGFTSVLLGQLPLHQAIQRVAAQDRLSILASGPIPPNPSELLSGRRAVDVITALQSVADMVLIDCPPVLPVTDAAVLSSRVDGTLLVTSARTTRIGDVQRAVEVLRGVGAPLIGVVLNGVSAKDGYGYAQYGYYRHDDAAAPAPPVVPAESR